MPANSPTYSGLKVVSVRSSNPEKGLPSVAGSVLLLDAETGLTLALMNATHLTGVRTACGSAVATDVLARKDADVLAIYGAGRQAYHHAIAISHVRKLREIRLHNRTSSRAVALQATLREELPGVSIVVCTEAKQAATGASIIATTTNSSSPVLKGEWLMPGCHVNCIGSYTEKMQEVDEEAVLRALVVVDEIKGAWEEAGDLIIPLRKGLIKKDHVQAEIGELLAKSETLRKSDEDITLFKSVGVSVQDLYAAALVYETAVGKTLGTKAPL